MLFNSYIYFLLFLPLVCIGYFLLARRHAFAAKSLLVLASLFFYGWWDVSYLPLIIGSCIFNYMTGRSLMRGPGRKLLLLLGIGVNIGLLGYFKYADFLLENIMILTGQAHGALHIVLPLAISFFTFQQIAYLVDCYKKQAKEYDFINYMVFVCFFPQLIAGPIVHHSEMMPQFEDPKNRAVNPLNIALGLLLFAIGFFKKVVLADSYAVWAGAGFADPSSLGMLAAWGTSLSYTLQLYFDFSGYTDMAIGSALLLNIRLPFNFNSPYKAVSIQDFWRRWHMTLSRFLRDYLYIPLGGSRAGKARVLFNLFVTFLLGGLWHGAAWTFVIWGALHGAAMALHRLWSQAGLTLPKLPALVLTFLFVNAAWVVFRAETMGDALHLYKAMLDVADIGRINILWAAALLTGLGAVWAIPNSNRVRDHAPLSPVLCGGAAGILLFVAILVLEIRKTSEFLYFQF
ncbi:MAG: MBOAT family protein [Rhodospirillales bacterium]|nr:MBOAT family protein [Rhodospirillales bacterium]MCB9996907.1 MBOAT family protein [Rhodospirillales bacterium]